MVSLSVQIRPIAGTDADALRLCASDARVAATSGIPHPYPNDGAIRWIERTLRRNIDGTEKTFAILENGAFAGVVMLREIDVHDASAVLEYFVAYPLWNRGIATEAARHALRIGFESLERVRARTLGHNRASARVLEKLGFARGGTERTEPGEGGKFAGVAWDIWELRRSEWTSS